MKSPDVWHPVVTVCVCLLLGLGALGVARATEPTPPTDGSAAATLPIVPAVLPSTSPPRAPIEANPTEGRLSLPNGGWLPPATSSKKPEAADWDGAAALELPRKHCSNTRTDGTCRSTCTAKVLREWVRISCKRAKETEVFMGVRVLAGPTDDVSLVDPPGVKGDREQRGFSLVFPVRRGDRRTIEIAEMLPLMWKAWTIDERLDMVVSATWLSNAARPTVTVY